MVRSAAVRRLASRARPRCGFSLFGEGFEVRLTLMTIAQPGRNDATDFLANLGPIREDDGEGDALRQTDGDDPSLSVVLASVLALQRGPFEHESREVEVEVEVAVT